MPSPPQKGESQEGFLARCHKYMDEHESNRPSAQRSAICYNLWRKKHGVESAAKKHISKRKKSKRG